MTQANGELCPSCFGQTMHNGVCCVCGYVSGANTVTACALPPFTILRGRYLLGKELGAGGFGVTYKAVDLAKGQLCCVKEYFPSELVHTHGPNGEVQAESEAAQAEFNAGMQRFMEEASTLQELRGNVSVVDIQDYFEANGTAYFVMELLEGYNLREFTRNHTPEQDLGMGLQMLLLIGSALSEVHRFGLLHGDISPENIIITGSGEIKLIDFGAARSFTRQSASPDGKILLKPNYAPYEQYSRKPYQGPWTDIYALAATFYMLVSGQHMVDAPSRAKGQQYTPLCALSPLIPQELSDVIDHALAFDYHDRYRSMPEFLADLERVIPAQYLRMDMAAMMEPFRAQAAVAGPARLAAQEAKQAGASGSDASGDSSAQELRMVEAESIEAPKRRSFWPFGGHKKQTRMACLELTIRGKTSRRWVLPANQWMQIGRSVNSDIKMPVNNRISRAHCELYYNEKKQVFLLRDHSRYGTFFPGGEQLTPNREYTLRADEQFCILTPPDYMFKVVIEE